MMYKRVICEDLEIINCNDAQPGVDLSKYTGVHYTIHNYAVQNKRAP